MSDFDPVAPMSPNVAKARRRSFDSPSAETRAARRSSSGEADDRYIPNRHATNLDVGLLARVESSLIPNDCQENNEALKSLIREELLGYSPGRKTQSREVTDDLCAPNVFKFRQVSYGSDVDGAGCGTAGALAPPPHARASLTAASPRAAIAERHCNEPGNCYVRKIKKTPYKVLDAPGLKDDFYLNLIDWSQRNVLAVGLGSRVYLWSATTAKIRLLCDFGTSDSVSSLVWLYDGTHLAIGTSNGRTVIYDISTRQQLCELAPHSARVGSLAWCGFSSSGRISFGSPSSPGESSSPHGRHTPSIASVVSAPPIGTGACSGLLASGSRDKSIFLHDPRIRSFYGSPDDFPRNIDSLFSTPSKDLGDVSDLFTASRLSSDTRPPLFPAMSLDGCSNQGSSLDDWISVSSDACASSDIIHAPLSLGLGSLARSGFNRDSLLCDGMATYSFPSSRAGLECTNEPGNGTLSPNSEFNDGYSTKLTDSPHILKVVSSSIEEQSFSDGLFDDFVYPSTPPRPSSSHKVTSPSVFSTPHRDSPSGQAHRRTISSSPVSTGARRSGSGGGMDSPFARYPTFTPPKSRKSASNHSFGASPSLSQNFSHPPGVVSVLSMHRQEICGLKWSLDGTHLASGSNDNNLCVWKPMHGRGSSPLHVLSEHSAAVKALAWSPHQHHVLASGGGTADRHIRFWNVLTGSALERVDTGSQVCNLAWSSHSNEIVSTHGYSLNQIVVWKYPSMQKLATLTGHSYRVLYLSVSPDGQSIVTGAGDETLRFWSVFPAARPPSALVPDMGSIR